MVGVEYYEYKIGFCSAPQDFGLLGFFARAFLLGRLVYFCSKETLEEHLAQDAPRVFLCYKNTYARENYSPRRGPVPGRKAGRPPFARALLGAARRNPACDVDKMPSPNFWFLPGIEPEYSL